MDTRDILHRAGADLALQKLAATNNISPQQLDAIVAKVVPALSARIERNTLSRGGLADMVGEILRPEHGRVLADPGFAATPAAAQVGIGALDTVFGSKDTSRSVAAQAAVSSGVQQAIIQKLLPIIASLVMAALSKGMQGGLGDVLKRLPDLTGAGGGDGGSDLPTRQPAGRGARGGSSREPRGNRDQPQTGTANDGGLGRELGDILSKIPGFPGGAPASGSQPVPNPTAPQGSSDDAFGGGMSLPLPGDRIPGINAPTTGPYSKLPDVIRKGGQSVDGSSLGQIVRNILGSALGFQSKGILGWIIQLIVLRWGWGFVQRILGRFLTGR